MRLLVLTTLVVATLAVPGVAQAQGTPGLEFAGPDELSVALDGDEATKSVWVRNNTQASADPTFETQIEDGDGAAKSLDVAPAIAPPIGAGKVKRYRLKFSTTEDIDSASGELVVTGDSQAAADQPAVPLAPGTLDLDVSKK